jgi:sulfur transfer protein SufE
LFQWSERYNYTREVTRNRKENTDTVKINKKNYMHCSAGCVSQVWGNYMGMVVEGQNEN